MRKKKLRFTPEEITALVGLAAVVNPDLFVKVSPEVLAVIYKCKAAVTIDGSIAQVPEFEIRD